MKTLTPRDRELCRILVGARWLSTRQIHRLFFGPASTNAVNKRMRRLVEASILYSVRPSRTGQTYFRLTALGMLTGAGLDNVSRPAHFPRQIEHFEAINDLRIWFMQNDDNKCLKRFLAEWEYRAFQTRGALIPDALVAYGAGSRRRLALEIDLATENARTVAAKILAYGGGDLARWPVDGLLIYVPGLSRFKSVIAACYRAGVCLAIPCWLANIGALWSTDAKTPCFVNLAEALQGKPIAKASFREVLASPLDLSSRREGCTSVTDWGNVVYENRHRPKYQEPERTGDVDVK